MSPDADADERSGEPTLAQLGQMPGAAVLEFGTSWCGVCSAAQPFIHAAMAGFAGVPHFRIEDGPGRAMGRHFKVKLWPTLVFLNNGVEVARLVRPRDTQSIQQALQLL